MLYSLIGKGINMKRNLRLLILLILTLVFSCNLKSQTSNSTDTTNLWPEIEPFHTAYLNVSDVHEIYYELCGNPKGKPVFVIHGGPGGQCTPYYRRFFNPAKFLIVLFDQRGSGKSKPLGELRQNSTQDLIEDIEELRIHLNLDKIVLFGGSWGSTLCLAYAEKYPNKMSGMVLRGVFTATEKEMDHIHYQIPKFFPVEYDNYVSALPDPNKVPTPDYLFSSITKSDDNTAKQLLQAWLNYESKTNMLEAPANLLEEILSSSSQEGILAALKVQQHYVVNQFFLEDGQILRNVNRISHIPIILINGRYDMYCPPEIAYRLHKMLPKSELIIVERAGHWMGEEPIEKELIKAMENFE
jgi:proline iminopeptidase